MLIDHISFTVKSGHGGAGNASFAMNRKPDGGNGGDGGDVILLADHNIYDFTKLSSEDYYTAADGQPGGRNRKFGKNGKDLVLHVPLVTKVYDSTGNLIVNLATSGQEYVIAKGGRGGLGNYNFRAGQVATLYKTTPGRPGIELTLKLELELKAEIIFIGLPNAGKSSMLNAISRAQAKVAPYPFTTLEPNLAIAQGLTFMDLPGLIEGTAQGKGLGTGFAQHTKYAKLVVHFLAADEPDISKNYHTIRNELAQIDSQLAGLPEVVLLSKKDLLAQPELAQKTEEIRKLGPEFLAVSINDKDTLTQFLQLTRQHL